MSGHTCAALNYRQRGLHPIVIRPNMKSPLEPGWQHLVNRNPETIREAFERAPEGHGIGTVCEDFLVLDIDERPGVSGSASLRQLPVLPPTLTSETPSGGRHLFFKLPPGVTIRNSVSKVAPGIDVRGTGGQVVLPPTVINGRPYLWVDGPEAMAELPAAWVDLLVAAPRAEEPRPAPGLRQLRNPADVAFEAERRRLYMATLTEPSVQGQGGNAVMMRAAFRSKEMSRTEEEALAALAEWNVRCATPPWTEHELRRAIHNSDAVLGAGLDRPAGSPAAEAGDVAWVEKMQAYVARDRKTGTWNISTPMTEKGATAALVARGIVPGRARELLKDWQVTLAARVDCDPSQPATFTDGNETVLNNYKPPRVQPSPGEFPVVSEVIGFLTNGDADSRHWVENWLAFAAQNPGRMMRTALVFYGAQRTGKSLMARVMGEVLGLDNCTAIRNEDIKGRFTSHFVNKLFVTVGEIEASEVPHATSTLKHLTGEPTLQCEAKGASPFTVPNRLKLMCTSNETVPVKVEDGDTRWALFPQFARPKLDYNDRMQSLFDRATNAWTEKGEAELSAFAHFLLHYAVDERLASTPPRSAARDAAMEASANSVESFANAVDEMTLDGVFAVHVPVHQRGDAAFAMLDVPGRAGVASGAAVYALYQAFAKATGRQSLGAPRFTPELRRARPRWFFLGKGGEDGVDHRILVDGRKTVAWSGLPRNPAARLPVRPADASPVVLAALPLEPPEAPQLALPDAGLARAEQLQAAAAVLGGHVARRAEA
jgi:hypothetical protein